MAIRKLRKAIADTIFEARPDLNPYDTIPGALQVPSFVVAPAANFAAYDLDMGPNGVRYHYEIFVLTQFNEPSEGQYLLDELLDVENADSLIQVLRRDPTFGGVVEDSHVSGIKNYGGKFSASNIDHIGAIITLEVHPEC